MPVAIPFIAGAAASWGAVTALGLTVGTFAATVVGGIASFAASTLVGGLMKNKPTPAPDISASLSLAGGGRTQQIRQPIAPHEIPFGRVKKSGPMLFVDTEDAPALTNGYFYVVHGISGTHVKAIGEAYLNQDVSTDPVYSGLVRFGKHLGDEDQLADGDLVAEIGAWTEAHRLRGRAYVATRLKFSNDAFGHTGVPNIPFMVDGVDEIFDPRTNEIRFTNNAALCIAKWLTADFGMGRAWEELDEDALIAAANICDERVPVFQSSTTFTVDTVTGIVTLAAGARVLNWGDGVRVGTDTPGTLPTGFSYDTTYYVIPSEGGIKLASSVALAFAGTAIVPTDSGGGPLHFIYYDEARYKLDGVFTLDVEKGEVISQLQTAMAGVVVYIGGKWFIHAGAPTLPTVTFDDDDLRGRIEVSPKRGMRDRFNGVRAVYVSPNANWQPTDAPILQSAAYLAEDNAEELFKDARYSFTTSTPAVQRLMKIDLEQNRRQMTVKYPAKLTGMLVQVWDGVYITSSEFGWEQKQFRVIGWALSEDGGIDLTLQEDDADVFAWTAADEQSAAPIQDISIVDPRELEPPPTVTVNTPNAVSITRIFFEWSASATMFVDSYDVEFKASTNAQWTSYGRVSADAERKAMVERPPPQDFRVRSVISATRKASVWTTNLAPSPPTSLASPASGELSWTNGAGADLIYLFKDGVIFNAEVPITPTLLTGLNDGSYQMRSINANGNMSAMSASVVLTASGTGSGGAGEPGVGDDDDGDGDGDGDE